MAWTVAVSLDAPGKTSGTVTATDGAFSHSERVDTAVMDVAAFTARAAAARDAAALLAQQEADAAASLEAAMNGG